MWHFAGPKWLASCCEISDWEVRSGRFLVLLLLVDDQFGCYTDIEYPQWIIYIINNLTSGWLIIVDDCHNSIHYGEILSTRISDDRGL